MGAGHQGQHDQREIQQKSKEAIEGAVQAGTRLVDDFLFWQEL